MVVTKIINIDFTKIDPMEEEFRDITYILLDPSCSGSGLERLEYSSEYSSVKEDDLELSTRLRNLAIFQIRLLKHALLFPNVERVVYSTCSHHVEENEQVVRA